MVILHKYYITTKPLNENKRRVSELTKTTCCEDCLTQKQRYGEPTTSLKRQGDFDHMEEHQLARHYGSGVYICTSISRLHLYSVDLNAMAQTVSNALPDQFKASIVHHGRYIYI